MMNQYYSLSLNEANEINQLLSAAWLFDLNTARERFFQSSVFKCAHIWNALAGDVSL